MKRALLMSSGANRGSWYAGFLEPLQRAGVEFEILAGVSAGGIAAAWFAAGDAERLIDSWRVADASRIAMSPLLSFGRYKTVDRLIQDITLQMMDLEAARTAKPEVRMFCSRIVGRGFPVPKLEGRVFSSRDIVDDQTFGQVIRATAYLPWINGFGTAIEIDGERYLDGGLTHRVPLSLIPEGRVDEIWIAACSPTAAIELEAELVASERPERIVVLKPDPPLTVTRWTMDWPSLSEAIEQGRRKMRTQLETSDQRSGR